VFLEDYIITALVGTLKIIVQAIEKNKRIFSETGNVSHNLMTVNYIDIITTINGLPDTLRND